jgi:hypothetical protein
MLTSYWLVEDERRLDTCAISAEAVEVMMTVRLSGGNAVGTSSPSPGIKSDEIVGLIVGGFAGDAVIILVTMTTESIVDSGRTLDANTRGGCRGTRENYSITSHTLYQTSWLFNIDEKILHVCSGCD